MREQINEALREAVRARDKRRISTLRLINAAIKDRDIAARAHDQKCVSDAEVLEILSKMVRQRRESVQSYTEAGRPELAQQEQEEIDVIESFLPRPMDEAETRGAVAEVMDELDCDGLKDMGRAMGLLKQRYAGRMDFSRANRIVKEQIKQRCG